MLLLSKQAESMSIQTLCLSSSVSVKLGDDVDLGAAAASAELSNKAHEKPGPFCPCNSSLNVVIYSRIYNKVVLCVAQ